MAAPAVLVPSGKFTSPAVGIARQLLVQNQKRKNMHWDMRYLRPFPHTAPHIHIAQPKAVIVMLPHKVKLATKRKKACHSHMLQKMARFKLKTIVV